MLLNQALLPQTLPWRPSLETNESVPPLRKKGGEVPFRKKKNVIGLSLNVLI